MGCRLSFLLLISVMRSNWIENIVFDPSKINDYSGQLLSSSSNKTVRRKVYLWSLHGTHAKWGKRCAVVCISKPIFDYIELLLDGVCKCII